MAHHRRRTVSTKILKTALFLILCCPTIITDGATKKAEAKSKQSQTTSIDTTKYANICSDSKPGTETRVPLKDNDRRGHRALRTLIEASTLPSIQVAHSSQHKAACWMLYDDPLKLDPRSRKKKSRFLERYALLVLYFSTHGANWERNDNWATDKHECRWYGVTCSRPNLLSLSRCVTELILTFNNLDGLLPRELSLLKQLREIDFHGNELQGVLPNLMLGALSKLRVLKLHLNSLFGVIPGQITGLHELNLFCPRRNVKGELYLYGNYFQGHIPPDIGSLSRLEIIDLSLNMLTGVLTSKVSDLTSLKELYLNDNDLVGKIPKSVCTLKDLAVLTADCLGNPPEVFCECCTACCKGGLDAKCVNMKKKEK